LAKIFLLVDDEMWQLEGLQNILLSLIPDATTFLARDGEQALNILMHNSVDMIFLDIRMPVMDGIAFLAALRDMDRSTPVVIISAFSEFLYAQKAMRHGASDYLLKPYKPADIAEVLSKNIAVFQNKQGQEQRIAMLLSRLLDNKLTDSDKDELLAWINWPGGVVISVHIPGFEDNPGSASWAKQIIYHWPNAYVTTFSQGFAHFALLVPGVYPEEAGERIARWEGSQLRFGISQYASHLLADIPNAWLQAQEALALYVSKTEKLSDFDLLENCLAYLEENLNLSLQEAADRFYFNPSYFSSLIKRRTGMSYSQYIHYLRMKRARMLLLDTKLLVQEVAIQTGYHDPRYFSRVFRQEYGVSPDQYRRQHTVRGLKNASEK